MYLLLADGDKLVTFAIHKTTNTLVSNVAIGCDLLRIKKKGLSACIMNQIVDSPSTLFLDGADNILTHPKSRKLHSTLLIGHEAC